MTHSDKEIKNALRTALNVARRYGHYIDDEARSLCNYVAALAIRKWEPSKCDFVTWVTERFLRSIYTLRRLRTLEETEHVFIPRQIGRDDLQRILMEHVAEPARSLCFAIWIDGCTRKEVADYMKISVEKLEGVLHEIQCKVIRIWEDTATC